MTSTVLLPTRRWTCDRCGVTRDEPGEYRPTDWTFAAIIGYGDDHTEGDYCKACTSVLEKAFAPLRPEPFPDATETTMGGR